MSTAPEASNDNARCFSFKRGMNRIAIGSWDGNCSTPSGRAITARAMNGETIGSIEFTLLETSSLDEKKYEYRSHASVNHQVIDGPRPPLVPPTQPLPKFDPRHDPRVKFREDWLKNWQNRGGSKG